MGLGAIVTGDAAGLSCTRLPFLLEEGDPAVLTAHMHGVAALAIFQGPHAYVSPNWYDTKRRDGRAVPTWNYLVVQAHGRVEIIDDAGWVHDQVTRLTARHESRREEPWTPEDAPPGYIDALIKGLVGLRIRVDRLEGRWKINQNHPAANRASVIQGLRATGEPPADWVAEKMSAQEALRERS